MKACLICRTTVGRGIPLHRLPSIEVNAAKRSELLKAVNRLDMMDSKKHIYLCKNELPEKFFGAGKKRSSLKINIGDGNKKVSQSQVPNNSILRDSTNYAERVKFRVEQAYKDSRIQTLMKSNRKKDIQIFRLRKKIKELEEKNEDLRKRLNFEDICKSKLDEPLLSLVLDSAANRNKPGKGYRFSKTTGQFATKIMNVSPKAYKLLRKDYKMILPSETTLNKASINQLYKNDKELNTTSQGDLKATTNELEAEEPLVMEEMYLDECFEYVVE